jgi:hypothetical protein
MITDADMLDALVDGQLDPEAAERLEASLGPEQRSYVERQRALRRRLAQDLALDALPAPPQRVLDALAPKPARMLQFPARAQIAAGAGWALAAALLVAVLVPGQPAGGLYGPQDGVLLAQGALAEALNQDLSGAQARGAAGAAQARVIASFAAVDGRSCRLFETQSARAAHAGLACREPQGWSVVAMVESAPLGETADGFRTASSGLPSLLQAAADELRQGDPMDGAAERRAVQSGWR